MLCLSIRSQLHECLANYRWQLQATDISQNSLVPAFELVHNTEEWVAPFNDAFAEPENPVPYAGAPAAGEADFTGGFGQGLANGHAEVEPWLSNIFYLTFKTEWSILPRERCRQFGPKRS